MHITPLSSHQTISQPDSQRCDLGWNIRLRCPSQARHEYGAKPWCKQQVFLTTPVLPSGPRGCIPSSVYKARECSWLALNLGNRLSCIWVPPAARVWAAAVEPAIQLSWRNWQTPLRRRQRSAKAVMRWKKIRWRQQPLWSFHHAPCMMTDFPRLLLFMRQWDFERLLDTPVFQ